MFVRRLTSAVGLFAVLFCARLGMGQISKGNQILLNHGLQVQGMVSPTDVFHLSTYSNANYTSINWIWDSVPSEMGAAPGFPWARWAASETNVPPQGSEVPYLSQLLTLQLGDEWNLNDVPTLTRLVNWFNSVRSSFPNTILYHNNYGGQVTDTNLGAFITYAQPDMLSFDTYPFWYDGRNTSPGDTPIHWYGDLRRYREFAKNSGIPLACYVQTYHSVTEGVRDPSPSELRLLHFGALAFNVKTLIDFTYNSGASSLFNNAAGGDNSPSALYPEKADCALRVRNLGKALVRLKPIDDAGSGYTTSIMFIRGRDVGGGINPIPIGFLADPDAPNNYTDWVFGRNDPYLAGWVVTNLGNKNGGTNGDVIISWFKSLDESFDGPNYSNEIYMMVVNALCATNGTAADCLQEIKLNFLNSFTSLDMLDPVSGQVTNVTLPIVSTRRQLVLDLNGGDAALFKIADGAPFVGFPFSTQAATLYWDTDGSTSGNNASTGANLGGSGTWSNAAANWWNTNLAPLQVWTEGSDAVFFGTAGTVTASTVSASNITFKTTGYAVNSGTLTMIGNAPSFTVDSNVTATINSTIAGSNTISQLGAGTLVLANTNNLNTADTNGGGWRIEGGGTVVISADTCLGAPLPDTARNTVTDIHFNQSTIRAEASFELDINRRTKINDNASTNRGDAIIDTAGHTLTWYGSLQGGAGSLRVIGSGLLVLGTDQQASINPFGSTLPGGTVNLTVADGTVVQTAGTVTPTGGELGSETNSLGEPLAVQLVNNGQIRCESGGYTFQRNLILGSGGGSLDTGAWMQTWLGTISGLGGLTKCGYGTLVLDNTSATWEGGTVIRAGTLVLGRGGSNGLLPGTLANPSSVVIDSGATLKFNRGSNKSFFDIFSGEGGLTIANTPTAKVRLVSDNTYTGPTTISSGILMIGQGNPDEPGSIVSSVVNNSGTFIFNRVEDLTYAGAINGTGTVEKQAAGKLTLTGTNSYSGDTTVSAGTLLVNGVIGTSAVIVNNGTLGGNGLIQGPVTIQSSGSLAPGTSIGVLTISNSLSLAGNTIMELNPAAGTNDLLRGLTSVAYGGTLTFSNLAGTITASSVFKLFSASSYSGTFATLSPASPGPDLAWNTNTLAADGTLRIVSTSPVMISNVASGSFLTLSWPADHIGWRLQTQTNSVLVGLSNNWVDVANSAVTNQIFLPVEQTAGCTFYRLIFP